jgi:RNA polymerase sigma-70 factor (ECF subfamily)
MTIETLFRENFRALTVYAMQFVKNKAVAEDIVQELFVSLYEKKVDSGEKTYNKSYLYKAVHNRCLNHNRDRKYRNEMNPHISEETSGLPDDPHKLYSFIEFQDMYLKVLENLSPKSREVFEMSRVRGLNNQEISDAMKISKRTVEKHIQLALKKLRKELFNYINI